MAAIPFLPSLITFLYGLIKMGLGRGFLISGDVYYFRAKSGLIEIFLAVCLFAMGVIFVQLKSLWRSGRKRFAMTMVIGRVVLCLVMISLLASAAYGISFASRLEVKISPDTFSYTSMYGTTEFAWSLPTLVQANPLPWYRFGRLTSDYAWINFSINRGEFGLHFPLLFIENPKLLCVIASSYWQSARDQ